MQNALGQVGAVRGRQQPGEYSRSLLLLKALIQRTVRRDRRRAGPTGVQEIVGVVVVVVVEVVLNV